MAKSEKINMPVYTYEFFPIMKAEDTLFDKKEAIKKKIEKLKAKKQDIFQSLLDKIAKGELVPSCDRKKYRCKTLYNQGGIMIFKIENLKTEEYDYDFATASHKIGPYCHVVIDNRKDMQHIAIERKPKAFTSTNMVVKILSDTLKPLLKAKGLALEINPQYQPKEFWDYVKANRRYGIREVRFYFPYPNLPAISDKYGDYMKKIGLDYHCMTGIILLAPDDMDILLDKDDEQLNFWIAAACESGVPIDIRSKRPGAYTYKLGKKTNITWPIDKNVLEKLDPKPQEINVRQMNLNFMDEEEKTSTEDNIISFANNGRFMYKEPANKTTNNN